MKRCPECRRNYHDDSLLYCLDDGSELLEGPASVDEPATAILPRTALPPEALTHELVQGPIDVKTPSAISPGFGVGGRQRLLAVLGIAVFFLVGGFFGYLYFASSSKQIDSIAVMPFVNETGTPDLDYLSDGITETLISNLSQLSDLNIKARSTVFRYKGKQIDANAIGRELGVGAILIGKVAQRSTDLSLYIELIDAESEKVIWSDTYDRPVTDLASLQREIARDVSRKLRLKLTGQEEQKVAKKQTENSEAYKLYLQGRFYWNKRTGEGVTKSVEYFDQAIVVDPTYALAFAGLADAYSVIPSYANGSPDDYFPKAKAAAKRALELDESLAEAHTALARVLFAYEWKFAESDREYRRAIELNPNYATAHHWYGNANLLRTGRFDEAIAEMRRAEEIDPFSLIINADLGETYFLAGRDDEAIAQLRKTIEMDERFAYAHWWLGVAFQKKGLFDQAMAEYERSRQLNDTPWIVALTGQLHSVLGNKEKALESLSRLDAISKSVYVPGYDFAILYAALGDKDRAFESLEKSYQKRDQRLTRLKVDGLLEQLRTDPRFAVLIKKVGLPE